MLAGMFRFVCMNGLVCGDVIEDIRIPHKGNVTDEVVGGAHTILDGFNLIREKRDDMRATTLTPQEQTILATSALSLRYDLDPSKPAPVTAEQINLCRRADDRGFDLWSTFNRLQENLVRGGLDARTPKGKRTRTREVVGIDSNMKLNRALWMLAAQMQKLKA